MEIQFTSLLAGICIPIAIAFIVAITWLIKFTFRLNQEFRESLTDNSSLLDELRDELHCETERLERSIEEVYEQINELSENQSILANSSKKGLLKG